MTREYVRMYDEEGLNDSGGNVRLGAVATQCGRNWFESFGMDAETVQ